MNSLDLTALQILLGKLEPLPNHKFGEHPRILLVDDEPRLLSSMVELLKNMNYQLVTATNGQEAIEQLNTNEFNIVLLDLVMPEKNGYDVLEHIKTVNIDVDVIVLSGCNDFDKAIALLKYDVSEYIAKPYQPEVLINAIIRILKRQQFEAQDLHKSWLLESSEEFYRFLINSLPDFIFILNAKGVFVFVNEQVHQLLGYEPGELIGKLFSEIVHAEDLQQAQYVFTERRSGERASNNIQFRVKCNPFAKKDQLSRQSDIYISCSSIGIYSQQRRIKKYVGTYGVIRDITEHKEAERLVIFQANHDILTGLPNRNMLRKQFNLFLAQTKKYHTNMVLMFIDLDRFKLVNDVYGHAKGDELLRLVTLRMLKSVRQDDVLARIGGDEFVLLQYDRQPQEVPVFVENFINNITQPYLLGNKEIRISASIGIAFYPKDGKTIDKLISNADMAMYQVKSKGKNGYGYYEPRMQNNSSKKIGLYQDLSDALDKGEFEMYFQPQIDARTNQIYGAEALIRWNHPKKDLLTAAEFIDLIEENGLVIAISEWTIETVCKHLNHWNTMGYKLKQISINLSPTYLERCDFAAKIEAALNTYHIDSSQIEIEILENINIFDIEHLISQLQKLNRLGVRVAIDDFGTGYSSLAYLKRFPIDTIKLDQSFIKEIKEDNFKFPIISAIISIAQGLNLNLIAEGVETEFQSSFLKRSGCYLMQGFLYSRPLPSNQFVNLLRKR
jgi:diguanylate cyclase (GGDEF)-like protein/PAS domain S-box-containing protein